MHIYTTCIESAQPMIIKRSVGESKKDKHWMTSYMNITAVWKMKIWEIVLSSNEIRCLSQKQDSFRKRKISKMHRFLRKCIWKNWQPPLKSKNNSEKNPGICIFELFSFSKTILFLWQAPNFMWEQYISPNFHFSALQNVFLGFLTFAMFSF